MVLERVDRIKLTLRYKSQEIRAISFIHTIRLVNNAKSKNWMYKSKQNLFQTSKKNQFHGKVACRICGYIASNVLSRQLIRHVSLLVIGQGRQ